TAQTAKEVAEKIRFAIESRNIPHLGIVSSPVLTVSVGVASMVPDQDEQPATLLNHADACLYQAKHEGRNRVVTEPGVG
ncbi:MAG: diguanylate cyclase, partial [Sulfuricella sp.]